VLFDTHLHTRFSHDSQMNLADAIKAAKEKNMGIIVTEHMDLNYPDPTAFQLDVAGYFREYRHFRGDNLLLGIEIGMGLDEVAENREIVEQNPFDFILGSVHVIDQIDLFLEEFYAGRTKAEVYGHYMDTMLACVKAYDFIDSLAHIDYICRYARFADPEIYYHEFTERMDAVLAVLVDKGTCLELNTRRLGNPAVMHNLLPIYKRYRELGGRYVTIGSDAHRPEDIGKHFPAALAMLEQCGLRAVRFKERQLQYAE
jgi:histidinol-phosphatase (PHP family)